MAVPATLSSDIANLSAAVTAAYPLAQAPLATLSSLQVSANAIVNEVQSAILVDDALIAAPVFADPISYVDSLNNLVPQIIEQSYLADLRGLVGRVAANLDQVGV